MSSSPNEVTKFCRNLPIKTNPAKQEAFLNRMTARFSYDALFQLFPDLDELAQCAAQAFFDEQISSEQLSTFLQLRTMKQEALSTELIPVFNRDNTLTAESSELLDSFLDSDQKERFIELLLTKPLSERYLYRITLPESANDRLKGLLDLAEVNDIISIEPFTLKPGMSESTATESRQTVTIVGLCSGARDAQLKTIYGDHAKAAFPMPGKLSINDIDASMTIGERPIAVGYPGIAAETVFHEIENAGQFYLTLHDQLHQTWISSIPNPVFYAMQAAIQLVREKTGFKWSKELWDCCDMEFTSLTTLSEKARDNKSTSHITSNFVKMLQGSVATESRLVGLFNESPLNDVMWILLIDLYFNEVTWQQRGISFPVNNYASEYYNFVIKNQENLSGKDTAEQVAFLKSKWFNVPLEPGKPVFAKNPSTGNYLQVEINGKAILYPKKEVMSTLGLKKILYLSSLDVVLHKDQIIFLFTNDASLFRWVFSNIAFTKQILSHNGVFSNIKHHIFNPFTLHYLNSEEDFYSLINIMADFDDLITTFSDNEYSEQLFNSLDKYVFQAKNYFFIRFLGGGYDLNGNANSLNNWSASIQRLYDLFPAKREILFSAIHTHILSSQEYFRRMNDADPALLDNLIRLYPHHSEEIISQKNKLSVGAIAESSEPDSREKSPAFFQPESTSDSDENAVVQKKLVK